MRRFQRVIFPLMVLCAAVATSCNEHQHNDNCAIAFVEGILDDPDSYESILINSYAPSQKGSVTVIGPADRCLDIVERFLSFDSFDNISGKAIPDDLPDFAGETIISIQDYANSPYYKYIDNGNSLFLREVAVRNTLLAIQGSCSSDPKDSNLSVKKSPAKVVIFAYPEFENYGKYDVDTLTSIIPGGVKVICSPTVISDSAALAEVFKTLRADNLFSHGVSKPAHKAYITYPASGLGFDAYDENGMFNSTYKYSRETNSRRDTYVLLEYSNEYFPGNNAEDSVTVVPIPIDEHVQD